MIGKLRHLLGRKKPPVIPVPKFDTIKPPNKTFRYAVVVGVLFAAKRTTSGRQKLRYPLNPASRQPASTYPQRKQRRATRSLAANG